MKQKEPPPASKYAEANLPEIFAAAMRTNAFPMTAVHEFAIAFGLGVEARSELMRKAHKYLWDHQEEYPWMIDKPDDV